jgi:broad specificity phosphatase PhoE
VRERGIRRVYASDLERAVATARVAAPGVPLVLDWRLRECNYGQWNGAAWAQVHGQRLMFLDEPYPGGESWRDAAARVGRFLDDLRTVNQSGPILIIGHTATRLGLDHYLGGVSLAEWLSTPHPWQPGWRYQL